VQCRSIELEAGPRSATSCTDQRDQHAQKYQVFVRPDDIPSAAQQSTIVPIIASISDSLSTAFACTAWSTSADRAVRSISYACALYVLRQPSGLSCASACLRMFAALFKAPCSFGGRGVSMVVHLGGGGEWPSASRSHSRASCIVALSSMRIHAVPAQGGPRAGTYHFPTASFRSGSATFHGRVRRQGSHLLVGCGNLPLCRAYAYSRVSGSSCELSGSTSSATGSSLSMRSETRRWCVSM